MIDSWNAAKLNERINQVEQKITVLPSPEYPTDLVYDGTEWKTKALIWENSDPTSAITSLTDVNVSDYTNLEFIFAYTTSVKTEIITYRPNGDVTQQVIVSNYNIDGGDSTYTIEMLYRTVTISGGKLSLSNGLKKKVTDGVFSSASSGSFLIPLRIYGY